MLSRRLHDSWPKEESDSIVIVTKEWTQNTLLEFDFQVFESICMCTFFFLQAFCSIRKSFTFYQVLRSDLTLGLQLLKGRNTSRMPEDTLLPVPKDTATSAWVDFYAPVLCWGHVGVTGPWVPCLCLMRTWCAGGMSGVFPCLDLCTTESYLFLNLAPQSPISRASLSSASTAAHQAAWRPFLIWQEELCPMPADRRLPKGVLASVHSG